MKTRVCASQGVVYQNCFVRVFAHVSHSETPGRRPKSCVLKNCNTQKAVVYYAKEKKNWGVLVG